MDESAIPHLRDAVIGAALSVVDEPTSIALDALRYAVQAYRAELARLPDSTPV